MPDKHGDPDHEVIEEDIHDLREDVQSLKLAYGFRETFNNEFRQVVQDETKDIKEKTQAMAVHFAGIDGRLKILLWLLGILAPGIIGLIIIVVLFVLEKKAI